METTLAKRLAPFSLSVLVFVLDQAVKTAVAAVIAPNAVHARFGGDLLWIVHQRNKGVAFSFGEGFPDWLKTLLFVVVASAVLVAVIVYCLRDGSLTRLQRWAAAGIVGGGFGNIVDRVFRADGVVDFISVKFFGLFGLERWPTFNIADSSVVVCGILLVVATIIADRNAARSAKADGKP